MFYYFLRFGIFLDIGINNELINTFNKTHICIQTKFNVGKLFEIGSAFNRKFIAYLINYQR